MTRNIKIRAATEDDFPIVLSLIKELAALEKAPREAVKNSVEQMKKEKGIFHCLLAETGDGAIAGMAVYFFAYFTWVGKSLYLDDIFVKEKFRKRNIGTSLLLRIFEVAIAEGCKRVRWQVLKWNRPAIEFYRKHGAEINDEWLNCTFSSEGIENCMP